MRREARASHSTTRVKARGCAARQRCSGVALLATVIPWCSAVAPPCSARSTAFVTCDGRTLKERRHRFSPTRDPDCPLTLLRCCRLEACSPPPRQRPAHFKCRTQVAYEERRTLALGNVLFRSGRARWREALANAGVTTGQLAIFHRKPPSL